MASATSGTVFELPKSFPASLSFPDVSLMMSHPDNLGLLKEALGYLGSLRRLTFGLPVYRVSTLSVGIVLRVFFFTQLFFEEFT